MPDVNVSFQVCLEVSLSGPVFIQQTSPRYGDVGCESLPEDSLAKVSLIFMLRINAKWL